MGSLSEWWDSGLLGATVSKVARNAQSGDKRVDRAASGRCELHFRIILKSFRIPCLSSLARSCYFQTKPKEHTKQTKGLTNFSLVSSRGGTHENQPKKGQTHSILASTTHNGNSRILIPIRVRQSNLEGRHRSNIQLTLGTFETQRRDTFSQLTS